MGRKKSSEVKKVAKVVMKYCMTVVHEKCGSPKNHKTCASNFLKKCIAKGRKNAKTFTLAAAQRM